MWTTLSSRRVRTLAAAVVAAAVVCGMAAANEPASTAFTYQGRLTHAGLPVTGPYEFEFRLYDSAAGGNLVASLAGIYPADVEEGHFTARLDFGPAAITGVGLWLEIGVRPESDMPLPFTILHPRQELTATPYAAVALNSPFRREGSGLFFEGRLGLGSDTPPSGMFEVAGPPQDASVVLPQNAISAHELMDEPGASGAFREETIWFDDDPVTLASATIQCPAPGYVLAMGTASIRSVVYHAAGGFVGIEATTQANPTPPADALFVQFSGDTPGITTTCPVSLQKVFPVSAGLKTFHLRGWVGFGDNNPRSVESGLTLLFIPTAYGSLPQ